jgi:hypothetical protein
MKRSRSWAPYYRWIPGDKNPADAMTKHKGNKALDKIIETNEIDIEAAGWVERDRTISWARIWE